MKIEVEFDSLELLLILGWSIVSALEVHMCDLGTFKLSLVYVVTKKIHVLDFYLEKCEYVEQWWVPEWKWLYGNVEL